MDNKKSITDIVDGFGRRKEEWRASVSSEQMQQQDSNNMFKVVIDGDDGGVAMRQVYERIRSGIAIRSKYKVEHPMDASTVLSRISTRANVTSLNGCYSISGHTPSNFYNMNPWPTFAADAEQIRLTMGNSLCSKACAHRLNIIQERSRTFFLLNSGVEQKPHYRKGGGVLSAPTKVDNSVKISRSVCAQELLEFVVDTYQRYPEEVVGRNAERPQESLTLRELFESHGVNDPSLLTVEALGWHPAPRARTRSDEENPLHSLSIALQKTFLSSEGAFAPRMLKKVLGRNEQPSKHNHQATEYRVPLFCASNNELIDVANFLKRNEIGPYQRNMWILQLRFYDNPPEGVAMEAKTVQDQLDAIFLPLIYATINVDDLRYSSVSWLLSQTGALQIESSNTDPTMDFDKKLPPPSQMPCTPKPSMLYYAYYIHANLNILNSLRKRKGMNTLQLRVCGAQSNLDTMVAAYMFADVLTQARHLTAFPVTQYLFGAHAIGATVSPLHDNGDLNCPYREHPLPFLLHRCLKVSISTEKPMHFHHDYNALREEYSTAQKLFHLSAFDMTEIARNSVIMSSFSTLTKSQWLGESFNKVNNFELSEVTNVRLRFREEAWENEKEILEELHRICGKQGALLLSGRRRSLGGGGGLTNTNKSSSGALATTSGLSRWHFLSSVKDVEYFAVLDNRIRFPRTVISGPHRDDIGARDASPKIARALALRRKYIWVRPNPWELSREKNVEDDFQRKTATFNEDDWTFDGSEAVYIPFKKNAVHSWPKQLPTIEEFVSDFNELKSICDSVEVKDFSQRRLELLDHRFLLHLALNHANEAGMTENQASTNRDIYQAVKVDTHIHMAAGMTPRQMLQFLKDKIKGSPDDIAMKKGDDILTLSNLMTRCGIGKECTVDQLNVQADHTLFERFDNFNNKYNPMENPDLRTLLLKPENFMSGRYFAELIRNCFDQYSKDKSTYAENRLSIYGIHLHEWKKLASWFDTHGMASKHNKLIIQIPRVYKVFRGNNVVGSFGQYLQNIFQPLWECSLHPSEHPSVHNFLKHVSGFDSVDNEATIDLPLTTATPWEWTSRDNPPYNYYMYYLYANIRALNEFRAMRGFSTFDLRPHCGEAGSDEHLTGAFLCADAIGHGINLKNDPSMAYLYYLAQVGLHVAPLSNNALFLPFTVNPFPKMFRQGLNVSLSTDDPLMFHMTEEPLIEEYSIAARVWGLSPNDTCEIARYSVLQSGFDHAFKRSAIGERWYMSSSLGNDSHRTHISDIRVAFRFETYHTEVSYLETMSKCHIERAMRTTHQEQEINERQIWSQPEKVLLSTHDQDMEIALRDIDVKREQIKAVKSKVETLRRQQRSLVNSLTDIAARQKADKDAEMKRKRPGLVYRRQHGAPGSAGEKRTAPFTTQERPSTGDDVVARGRPLPNVSLDDLN